MIPILPAAAQIFPSVGDGAVIPLQQRVTEQVPARTPVRQDFNDEPLAQAFLDALRQLPVGSSSRDYAGAVSRLLREFVDPKSNKRAFATLSDQTAILQCILAKVGLDDQLYAPLQATLIGTSNLDFQMTKWMQDVCMSNGSPKEFEEW
ncbi:type III secretion system effector protein OrgC [Burkholderia sp. HI2714]|uniref:hypothetical protein n=1 Tax=Burkholderia sp. HI2714 TaxID=2015359 RepID=UPI000B79BA9A|nr:hypothetical protein [Burkholderia sp. HI2714]OXJ21378.1 type III secretion system effector protein OrgC [Burkholderia sp. HI2714]